MVYSYYMNDAGEWTKGKTFETWKEFKEYAVKHPKPCYVGSNTKPDLKGPVYDEYLRPIKA